MNPCSIVMRTLKACTTMPTTMIFIKHHSPTIFQEISHGFPISFSLFHGFSIDFSLPTRPPNHFFPPPSPGSLRIEEHRAKGHGFEDQAPQVVVADADGLHSAPRCKSHVTCPRMGICWGAAAHT